MNNEAGSLLVFSRCFARRALAALSRQKFRALTALRGTFMLCWLSGAMDMGSGISGRGMNPSLAAKNDTGKLLALLALESLARALWGGSGGSSVLHELYCFFHS